MATALSAGAREIRIFSDIESAMSAAKAFDGPRLLCGEQNALPPPGFDIGNSPPDFTPQRCQGRTLFMSTTNGTRAILAARGAAAILAGALVNASATAEAVAAAKLNVTLLCAGTNGSVALEDLLGCGAVLNALAELVPVIDESDTVLIARGLFTAARNELVSALRESRGGQNVVAAGLGPDIHFAARLNAINVTARVFGDPAVVVQPGAMANA